MSDVSVCNAAAGVVVKVRTRASRGGTGRGGAGGRIAQQQEGRVGAEAEPRARGARTDVERAAGVAGRSFILVLGVDDNEEVGRTLALRLAREPDLLWMGLLRSADALVEEAARLQPNIVLLDIDMPGKNPFTAMAELAERLPGTRVVMLSGHVRRELIDRAFAAGAWGYLSKQDGCGAVAAALRRVMEGEVVMSPDVASVMEG